MQRELAESLRQGTAGLDVGLDVEEQLADRRIGVAAPDDIEGLEQRDAGFHHGRQLAGEQRDILLGDLAADLEAGLLDLGVHDPLAAQAGLDDGLAGRTHFAAHRLAVAVLAFPAERAFPG